MDWHVIIGALAGLISIGATIPYLRDIVRGDTRPNVVSWSLWTIVVLITAFAQVSAGASWSLFLLIGSSIANISVVVLCILGYGYRRFELADKICLVLAFAALLFWWITSNPVIAIVLAVTADGIAYIPTYAKVYKHPKSETHLYWAILTFADMLALISVTKMSMANSLFPISYAVFNALVVVVGFLGRRLKKIPASSATG